MRLISLLGILLAGLSAAAADSPWGICSHPLWSKDPKVLPMEIRRMKEAGLRTMRMDFPYGGICRTPGEFQFERIDRVVDTLLENGIGTLAILQGYDNEIPEADRPLYRHPERWRSYVRKTVEHFKGRVRAYEIWNEPDGGFWKPAPDAAQYVKLLKIAAEEIRAADPGAKIISAGLCSWNASYIRELYRHGAAGSFDILGIHAYGYEPAGNSRAAAEMAEVRAAMAEAGDAAKPVWLTECGGSSNRSSLHEQQPDVMIRALDAAFAAIGRKTPAKLKIGIPADLRTKIPGAPPSRKEYPGAELFYYTPESLEKMNPAEFPVVVGSDGMAVFSDYIAPLQRYVKRGGVMIATSKAVPLYVRRFQKSPGVWSEKDDPKALQGAFRLGFKAWWTEKGLPESTFGVEVTEAGRKAGIGALRGIYSSRWMTGCSIPLIRAVAPDGKVCGDTLAVAVYPDWKGAVVANTMLLAGEYSEAEQATLAVRVYLGYLSCGVEKIFLYNLRNKGTNPAYVEDNFGIIRQDFAPKPAHGAIRAMTAALGASPVFEAQLSPEPARVQALRFRRAEDGGAVTAVWLVDPAAGCRVDGAAVTAGEVRYFKNGQPKIEIKEQP